MSGDARSNVNDVPPAKSSVDRNGHQEALSNPPAPDHGAMGVDENRPENEERAMALNFMRSASASHGAGVMMANIS